MIESIAKRILDFRVHKRVATLALYPASLLRKLVKRRSLPGDIRDIRQICDLGDIVIRTRQAIRLSRPFLRPVLGQKLEIIQIHEGRGPMIRLFSWRRRERKIRDQIQSHGLGDILPFLRDTPNTVSFVLVSMRQVR
jgi:hypothetical protein